jgi:hypothetical protein
MGRDEYIPSNRYIMKRNTPFIFALTTLCVSSPLGLVAQSPCLPVEPVATGLLAPSKIIQTPRGAFIVAEGGPQAENSGRVSIVDEAGGRRTLISGLPSARTFVGDFNGTTGVYLDGRTLFVLNGQGDVTLAGPVPGTERPNPTPASPIFSSVLAVHFSAAREDRTTGVALTLADHHALKSGETLVKTDSAGSKMTIRLIADFPDYAPEPRPNFAGNVRHSHPYGIVADDSFLYIVDAGFNRVRKLDRASGAEQTLASFAPTPNPGAGPPFIENVPTTIRWNGDQLLVTLLAGAPFLPGLSQLRQIDPVTGAQTVLLSGLTTAIDVTPVAQNDMLAGVLTLEFDLNFPAPGPGRLQFLSSGSASAAILSGCLTTPSSMVWDRKNTRLVISELATGRLVTLELP